MISFVPIPLFALYFSRPTSPAKFGLRFSTNISNLDQKVILLFGTLEEQQKEDEPRRGRASERGRGKPRPSRKGILWARARASESLYILTTCLDPGWEWTITSEGWNLLRKWSVGKATSKCWAKPFGRRLRDQKSWRKLYADHQRGQYYEHCSR